MLYITYDNRFLQDGAGAQLIRILSAYLVSVYYSIGYVHTPIASISYYGLKCMEEKRDDRAQIDRYNALFEALHQNNVPSVFDKIVVKDRISIHELEEYKRKGETQHILLKVGLPVFLLNENPSILNSISSLPTLSWIIPPQQRSTAPLKIGIHIRRGEILLVERDIRYLPNSYYVNIMKQITAQLKHIPHEFHIYTESVSAPIQFTGEHLRVFQNNQSVVYPEDHKEFSEFKNIVWHINTDPVESFIELCQYSILVISISCFSYLPALLTGHSNVIYPPRSHLPSHPSWIDMTQANALTKDPYRLLPYLTYCSGGLIGDFIHQLGIIQQMYVKTGKKGRLYISQSARRSEVFPFGLEKAYQDTYQMVSTQEYIESYQIHHGDPYHINLSSWAYNQPLYKTNWRNMFRNEYNVEWCVSPYLTLPFVEKYKNAIFFSCSARRFNSLISYETLFQMLPSQPIFVCSTRSEYQFFIERTRLSNIEYIVFDSLYEFHCAIRSCKMFIGNLSSPLTIAQACFVPRITILAIREWEQDNIHMNGIEWENCLYLHTNDDLPKISSFLSSLKM